MVFPSGFERHNRGIRESVPIDCINPHQYLTGSKLSKERMKKELQLVVTLAFLALKEAEAGDCLVQKGSQVCERPKMNREMETLFLKNMTV